MTVVPTEGGGAVAAYDPDLAATGLEDIGVGDVIIPRLTIKHNDGLFEDNLSKATFGTLKVVLLGLVKQRIMWDDEVDEGDKPKCKSPDFEHGFPNNDPTVRADKQFPWAQSNFDPANFPAESGLNGLVTLPCASCIFKEWDKGDWKQPPCNEQHTFPLLYSPDEGESWQPALLTVQRTGIKPSRQYISSFAQAKTPMFTVFTEISLTQQSRGTVRYCVPTFKRSETTDRNAWGTFAEQYRQIRDFIRQPPRRQEEDEGTPVAPDENVNAVPAAPAPAAAPAPTPAPPAAPPAAPAPPAPPAPPAAPAPAAAVPAPVAEPAPAPVPAAVAAAPAAADDDLPF